MLKNAENEVMVCIVWAIMSMCQHLTGQCVCVSPMVAFKTVHLLCV
jgi:hypothetical protein